MPALRVIRKQTEANVMLEFEFKVKGNEFTIKNFTGGDILVCAEQEYDESKTIMIPSNMAEIIKISDTSKFTNKILVMPFQASTRGVEVQCNDW